MQAGSRLRANKGTAEASTPGASTRSAHNTKKSSGNSSIDTRAEGGGKDKKEKVKSTICGDLCKKICHILFVCCVIFGTVVGFSFQMMSTIEWEPPKSEEPKMMQYYGASIITKDFDCSILARRCVMTEKKLRHCFLPSLMCNSMLRPDMFPPEKKNQYYYINIRHVNTKVEDSGKKNANFNTFHDKIKRPYIIQRLNQWNESFGAIFKNSKGMPRDNQLFFIPWELLEQEEKYKKHFDYVDLNNDDVNDCIQPKINTDVGRRNWIKTFNSPLNKAPPVSTHIANFWKRPTTARTESFRIDTVPGFAGALVKKIIDVSTALIDHELAHSIHGSHAFTDDMLLMIYRHVLLHALRNPFTLLFDEDKWTELKGKYGAFDPEKPVTFEDYDNMPKLSNVGSSISFLFGGRRTNNVGSKHPDSLAVTISEAKAKLGKWDFDLNVPISISNGLTNVEIVSSAQGERAFHANIITALRVMLRLRIYKDKKVPHLNDVLHIPMAFYSMEEQKMVFDRYSIKTPLRNLLCKKMEHCATPYDQYSMDWQTRFNGTTAIQYNGDSMGIMSRVDTTQDKRNYAVGF